MTCSRAQELCESRGGRRGYPSLIVPTGSVDVRQHLKKTQAYISQDRTVAVSVIRSSPFVADFLAVIGRYGPHLMIVTIFFVTQNNI